MRSDGQTFIVDDVDADARAAFAELSEKAAAAPAPEPAAKVEPEPREPVARAERDPDDGDPALYKDRPRKADGKFAKKDEAATDVVAKVKDDQQPDKAASTAGDKTKQPDTPTDQSIAAPAGGPPPSWSVKSKAAWDSLPPEVKADAIKREAEVGQGLAALKDYKDLKPYADMARQHGTTINKALENYVGIEKMLKQDLGRGIAVILQNYGYSKEQAAQFYASQAQRLGAPPGAAGTPPQAGAAPAAGADPLLDIMRPVLKPLMDEIGQFKGHFTAQQRHTAEAAANQQMEALTKALTTFQSDPANRYFNELEEQMTSLIEKGIVPLTGDYQADLRRAYEMAAGMHPEVREALIEQRLNADREARRKAEQEAADKAKSASRSITGSRIPGTVTRDRPEDNSHDDVEADVRRALRALTQA
jgi:hypothetical protein